MVSRGLGDVYKRQGLQRPNKKKENYDLCLLKTGEPTSRHPSHHPFSVPDTLVCDPPLAPEFIWQTQSDLCGVYRFPVILKTSSKDDEPSAET